MASRFHNTARTWVLLPFGVASGLLIRCSGTEADNPVTDAVVTACKSDSEYDSDMLGDFLAMSKALTRTADIPLGLSCVEWQLTDNVLDVQVVNFRGGCSVEWEAQTKRSGNSVTIFLENPSCAVAACGNCLYDTATSIELPTVTDIDFAVSMDEACTGEADGEEWRLPLVEQPSGMICGYARVLGLGINRGQAYAFCPQNISVPITCEDGFDCVDGGEGIEHCLPPCSTDADCPLLGGTHCEAGHCAPTESRDYF